jgi:hypothetical protein
MCCTKQGGFKFPLFKGDIATFLFGGFPRIKKRQDRGIYTNAGINRLPPVGFANDLVRTFKHPLKLNTIDRRLYIFIPASRTVNDNFGTSF